jgi:hypothetical protein
MRPFLYKPYRPERIRSDPEITRLQEVRARDAVTSLVLVREVTPVSVFFNL